MENISVSELLDLKHTIAAELFDGVKYPWEILPKLGNFIVELGRKLPSEEYDNPAENVWIDKGATVAESAHIAPPTIICRGAEVRHCAYIRGNVIIGADAVIGNSCELKNALIFDGAQIPHFNYVGDSIVGYKAHMGAGAITSNVKSNMTFVTVKTADGRIETGMKKLGAILGDFAEIGCQCVLNPGSVVCRNSNIYPLTSVRGVIPPDSICKGAGEVVKKV